MTSKFAAYRPARSKLPAEPIDWVIRRADEADCAAISTIEHDRDGVGLDVSRARCERQVRDPEMLLVVAVVAGEIAGFARTGWFDGGAAAGPHAAPAGWYLFGVIVRDRWRRRGIGRRLTLERLAWIRDRAAEAYYFTNARNRASLDLHAEFGFVELTRDFAIPGAAFEGGEGVLCRIDLERPATLAR